MRAILVPTLATVIALTCGCGHTASLDRAKVGGSSTEVDVDEGPVRGANAKIYLTDGSTVEGELLDVHEKWVAIETETTDVRVSVESISEIKVTAYSNAIIVGGLVGWNLTGTASTLSHGIILIFTAPVWIVGGVSSTVAAAVDSDQSAIVKAGYQTKIWQFVRFPQGIPADFPLKDWKAE